MKWKRIGSSALALVLVCCLIFNMLTVPVHADAHSNLESVTISGAAAVGSAFKGLGLSAGLGALGLESIKTLASDCWDSIRSSSALDGYVVDGNSIRILVKAQEDGASLAAVPLSFVESVWNWLFDSGAVIEDQVDSSSMSNNQAVLYNRVVSENQYVCAWWVGENLHVMFGTSAPFNISWTASGNIGWYCKTTGTSATYCYYTPDGGTGSYTRNCSSKFIGDRNYWLCGSATIPEITTGHDILIDSLLHPAVGFSTGYADWAATTQTITDTQGVSHEYVNLGVAETLDQSISLTQDQVVSGVSTITPVGGGSDVATGSFADTAVGAFILALLEALWTPVRWIGEPVYRLGEYVGQIVRGEITVADAWNQVLANVVSSPIVSAITKIISGEITLPQALSLGLSEIISGITSIAAPVVGVIPETLAGIKSWCISLPETLAGLFTSVIVEPLLVGLSYLFIPSEGFLADRVDALRAKFGFADGVIGALEVLVAMFNDLDLEPPVIWIDLGASRGSYDIGGKVKFVDLTWYAEYKPTVDVILSAFLWLWFIWRLALSLPGIISGTTGIWGDPNTNVDWPLSPLPSFREELPPVGGTTPRWPDSAERLRNSPFGKRTVAGYRSYGTWKWNKAKDGID